MYFNDCISSRLDVQEFCKWRVKITILHKNEEA